MNATYAERIGSEVYVYVRGRLVMKRWLDQGRSAVFCGCASRCAMKPIAPPAPLSWGIHAGIIKKDEMARAKFVDLGIEILKRVQKIAGYEDFLLMRLETAVALSELPEDMAARAWVGLCVNGMSHTYN